MKYGLFGLCIALLTVAAAACGGGNGRDAVAVVNGEEISRGELAAQIEEIKARYERQGVAFPQGPEREAIEREILNQLVRQKLVLQEADSRGIGATIEEIRFQYLATMNQFPDEETFNQAMKDEGLTEAELEQLIADHIKMEKLFASVVNEAGVVTPTEDELRALYEALRQQQELPPFEEVSAQLEAELLDQRESEVVQKFIQDLEAGSTIEILL